MSDRMTSCRAPGVFIGIDPGPVPGIVWLEKRGPRLLADAIQCTEGAAPAVLWGLLDSHRPSLGSAPALVQIEKFVVGRKSMKTGRAGGVTRDLVGRLISEAENQPNVKVVLRSASEVKPWATDQRLQAAVTPGDSSLFLMTAGMRHARDAARHALFAAVKDGGLPDPLSRRGSVS